MGARTVILRAAGTLDNSDNYVHIVRSFRIRVGEESPISKNRFGRTRLRWPALAVVVCGSVALLGLAPQSQGTSGARVLLPLAMPAPIPSVPPQPALAPDAPAPAAGPGAIETEAPKALTTETVTIARGDSLFALFLKHSLSPAELAVLIKAEPHGNRLARVLPGQTLEFHLDDERSIKKLRYRLDRTHFIVYDHGDNGFSSELVEVPLERRVNHASGRIDSSLFLAGQRAGLSNRLIMEMVEIFGWDIDFALDIREGDQFLVVYEELFENGDKVADGNILAAEFVNQNKSFRAVRYADPSDRISYFSPEGLSMRKAFLRTPVKFGRVSSRFNLRRRHPILHRIRAHRGVDYAAPPGTPIRASGDGKIIYAGRKGGYGQTVILKHGSTYTTLYAHMKHVARGIRPGRRVNQGQVIGYVGSSGLATGPHLHYEFRVRGAHRNPLTVKLPQAAPVPEKHKQDFMEKTAKLVSQLEVLSKVRLASKN